MAPIEKFEQIALVYLTQVYRAAVAICGRSDVADDMVQTTFLKAYERFGSFTMGTNCKAWLLRILRNSWVDHLRRERKDVERRVPLEDAVAAPPTSQETTWSDAGDLLDNFTDDQVIKALQQLPDDQRLTLYLVDVEQLSQEEVAEVTGVAVGTVKSRTSRARNALKDRLAAYAQDMHFTGGDV